MHTTEAHDKISADKLRQKCIFLEPTALLGYEGRFSRNNFHEIPKREQLALFKFFSSFPAAQNIQNYLQKKLL